MAGKKKTNPTVVVILLLLVMGLAGFGVTNFGGSLRTVATVGSAEIGVNDYARAVEAEVRRFQQTTGQPMTVQQAQLIGLDRQALSRVVTEAALEDEARRIGLSVGDANVVSEIRQADAFQSAAGFDRTTYEMALQQSNISVSDFETRVRSDLAEGLLRQAVASGVETPPFFTDTLFAFARETRDVTWARLTEEDLAEPLPEPSLEDLAAYHEANPDAFTRPETKVISYAWLTPDMLVGDVEVDDAQLRTLYDERQEEFIQPERRLVERLVYGSEAAAAEAKARLDADDATFDDLVAERGLQLADIDLGDVSLEDLGEAGEAIFALEEPGVVGPLPSSLGPALYRMNGVLAAQETSFEEVRDELAGEAAADRARRIIVESAPQIEDMLAGGADMALLAERTDMEAGTIEWNDEVFDDIAAYDAFRAAASQATPDSFPEVIELEDGGIVALKVDEVKAPELRPLEEVKDDVRTALLTERRQETLAAQAETIADQVRNGREMAALGLDLQTDRSVGRDALVEGTPPDFVTTLFQLKPDEIAVLAADGDAWVVRLDAVNVPDGTSEEAARAKAAFSEGIARDFSGALLTAYTSSLLDTREVEVNQSAISAVNAQLQ
ncbi:peptidylprolyl isomerase [Silicimonas algicola]|uniref:Peptidyl-prolyl cis-trans isomerase D n=1 Tax=Silicimonas algicola TaxID=1826607 RepID=A0A316G9M4_9RHOB|nr:peptidyl-prolyl cis-trans isomerase [Silicimonas algicola]AZQ67898.1 peptidylprolyl isomerase [Silicimonas algicola]PWK57669.1 peptidyl-prolyl cis-trans isomerase D [Silicimonas algicola]